MSTYAIRQKLITIARQEIGVVESPAGSNKGKRVEQYQSACDLSEELKTGWPWCAAFVCWCIKEWLKDPEVLAAFKFTPKQAEAWRPKTAAAYGFHAWAEKHNLLVLNDDPLNVLHTADIVTYDFSHIGIVQDDEKFMIMTVEGNTDGEGSRDGGGVFAKTRPRSLAKKFIRLLP
tara:strand:+ start:102 stop:626 length:525 start_codon:yes stop_codon:yes gene_type:complete